MPSPNTADVVRSNLYADVSLSRPEAAFTDLVLRLLSLAYAGGDVLPNPAAEVVRRLRVIAGDTHPAVVTISRILNTEADRYARRA